MSKVTVIPITGRIRGLSSEVRVGPANRLEKGQRDLVRHHRHDRKKCLGRQIGYVLLEQEPDLTRALHLAFDLA